MVSIIKFGLKVYNTSPLRDVVRRQIAPAPEDSATDESLAEYIKNNCGPLYHPLGTLSMLPREHGGVVDPELKVYGTANVRVVRARSPAFRHEIEVYLNADVSPTCL